MLADLRPQIEAIELPPGYRLEWWGEFRNSAKAKASLAGPMPLFFLMMVVLTVALFNAFPATGPPEFTATQPATGFPQTIAVAKGL